MPRLHYFLFFLLFSWCLIGTLNASAQADTTQQKVIISKMIITGNKITRLTVVTRELFLHEGDTIPLLFFDRLIERSRENLMNTGIFHFVKITPQLTDSNHAIVVIEVTEKWYIFPMPIFELVDRNFNEWAKSGDWSRVNYGTYINWDNFRGRNETLRFLFRWGYSQRIGLFYDIPYINKNQEEGISVGFAYGRNREAAYGVEQSKLLRFKSFDEYVQKEVYAMARYTRRSGFYHSSSFTAEYRYESITDTIANLNPGYLGQGRTGQELITLSYQFRHDRRDYKIYPLKGYLFDFIAVKNGLGLLRNEPDLLILQSQIKYYHQLANRWYIASSVKGKLSGQSEAPYFNQKGFGFGNDFVRGYEYYVVPGQNWFLNRNSLKFALLPQRVVELPISFLKKFRTIPYAFYLNANFDMGYARDRQFSRQNPLGNTWLMGYGVGLDYVTYYNLMFRLEYSFNKLGESGFFIHFTAPI